MRDIAHKSPFAAEQAAASARLRARPVAVVLAALAVGACSARADDPPRPAEGETPAKAVETFAYTDAKTWQLHNALLMTGLTGQRTTVPYGDTQLEVRQVEKTEVCSHILTDVWTNGKAPADDAHLRPYVVCPVSSAPATHEGGEKWLMKIQEADLNFNPTSEPTGWAAEAFPARSGADHLIRFETTVMLNSDRTRNGRHTYTLWRNVGGPRYVMADFAVPDDAATSAN